MAFKMEWNKRKWINYNQLSHLTKSIVMVMYKNVAALIFQRKMFLSSCSSLLRMKVNNFCQLRS